jgi:hypothetical protein
MDYGCWSIVRFPISAYLLQGGRLATDPVSSNC